MDGGQWGFPPAEKNKLPRDIWFLERYGVKREILEWAECRASWFGITATECLILNGLVSEDDYYSCVASELGLEFTRSTTAQGQPFFAPPHPDDLRRMSRMVQVDRINEFDLESQFGAKHLHLSPDGRQIGKLKAWFSRNLHVRKRLKVTPLSINREALEMRCAPGLFDNAVNGLRNQFSNLSAKQVFTAKQAVILVLMIQLLIVMAAFSTPVAFLFLHLSATLFYLGCIGLRLAAAMSFDRRERKPPAVDKVDRRFDHTLPVYSVLVPLYQEAGQADELIDSLLQIDWPKERLEIKLICEADDKPTIEVFRSALLNRRANHISVVVVPVGEPRTKPKALAYAVQLCRGSLVVVYDAEDRPHPHQLREAWQRFQKGNADLACLQAPLVIHNCKESWFSKLFAIEYSALFDGLIPALSNMKAPVPLGGTSNHFKRDVLSNLGGWDPYNVTEDADLGVRLARAGYRTGALRLPTYEEAPITLDVWVKQRTRWFKGWYQTWLVHMRNPVSTFTDLGFRNGLIFQLMILGMAVSALVHPLLLYFILLDVVGYFTFGTWRSFAGPLFAMDVATIGLGYFSFAWLAWKTLPVRNMSHLRKWLFGIPAYWLLLSFAAWRALYQLLSNPHFWEKTPHGMSKHRNAFPNGS